VRGRVRAARDLGEVAEGLRIVVRPNSPLLINPSLNRPGPTLQAATKLRAFFLALLQPIRASMTTNMHVIQTTVFLKYRPLYAFLLRNAANVATEVQKAYVATARTYYETGFRRYMRSLGWIKVSRHVLCSRAPVVLRCTIQARTVEKDPGLVSALDSPERQIETYLERLSYARIEGPGVTLAYMADDKTHVIILIVKCNLIRCSDNLFSPPYRKRTWKHFYDQLCWF
jgi:hypothetical protein